MAASKGIELGFGTAPRILVPMDRNRRGGVAKRAERATRWLWSRGIYPCPSAVNMRMRGRVRDCLNGIETAARNRVMAELGIGRQRRSRDPRGW